MVYFFYPFFFFGFLLTVFPRLLSVATLSPFVHAVLSLGYLAAALLFTFGLYAGAIWALAGVALAVVIAAAITVALLRMLRNSRNRDRRMPLFMWIGITFAVPGLLALAASIACDNDRWGMISEAIGIYAFLLPTIYAVAYRMVPIFTAISGRDVVRRRFGLQALLFWSLLRMAATTLGWHDWLWLPDAGLCVVVALQCRQWRIWQPKQDLIQSVRHWALFWLPLAFLFSAVINIAELVSGERRPALQLGALHALLLGGFGTLLLGMMTRVTLGHAGRAVRADQYSGRLLSHSSWPRRCACWPQF